MNRKNLKNKPFILLPHFNKKRDDLISPSNGYNAWYYPILISEF